MSDDDYWLEPSDTMGLWENQGGPLTVRWLVVALREAAPGLFDGISEVLAVDDPAADLPVEIEWYDGTRATRLSPMHIDVRAEEGAPAAVVVTVT